MKDVYGVPCREYNIYKAVSNKRVDSRLHAIDLEIGLHRFFYVTVFSEFEAHNLQRITFLKQHSFPRRRKKKLETE